MVVKVAAVFAAALAAAAVQAQDVQRCEAADGRVTYSNAACPAGSRPVRSVNTSPPVQVDERRAAQARAKKEMATADKLERERAAEQAQQERLAAQRKKETAKTASGCERAKRELAVARNSRAALDQRAFTVSQVDKAEREVTRREQAVAKACDS
jgi:hypothetical protein